MRLFCCLLICCSLSAVEGGLYRLAEDGAQPCDLRLVFPLPNTATATP